MSTDSNVDEDGEPTPVPKSENFVERVIDETVLIEGPDHVIIDCQKSDAHLRLNEKGDPVDYAGPLESSIRLVLTHGVAHTLAENLSDYLDAQSGPNETNIPEDVESS